MRIGLLNRWIQIQEDVPMDDGVGGKTPVWILRTDGWAAIKPLEKGDEAFSSGQRYAEQYYQFRMRYTSYLATTTTKMRVAYSGKYYDIKRIDDLNDRHREIRIYARLVNP